MSLGVVIRSRKFECFLEDFSFFEWGVKILSFLITDIRAIVNITAREALYTYWP